MNRGILGGARGRSKRIVFDDNEFCGVRALRVLSTFSLSSATPTDEAWDSFLYDTDRFLDLVNFPTRLRVPYDGIYACEGASYIEFGGSSGTATFELVRNGVFGAIPFSRHAWRGSQSMVGSLEGEDHFQAGDWLTLRLTQDTGVGKTVGTNNPPFELFSALSMERVG